MTKGSLRRIALATGAACAVFLAMPAAGQSAAQSIPGGVSEAARAGLQRFLTQLPRADLAELGIPASVPAERITLGVPFALDQILPKSLDAYTNGAPAASLFTPTAQHLCLVVADGSPRALLIVERMNGEWRAVSIGHPELAAQFASVLADWPESGGFHVRFAVSLQARQHVFTVAEQGAANLTVLRPGATSPAKAGAAGRDYRTLGSAADVVAGLKAAAGPGTAKGGTP